MNKRPAKPRPSEQRVFLVGTRKGAFVLRPGTARGAYEVQGPLQLGSGVTDFCADPRAPGHWLMTISGGHLGPTLHHSRNAGKRWTEVSGPPKFAVGEADGTTRGKAISGYFWLTPGHASEPGSWYLGTVPRGLFKSSDGGQTWHSIDGFNLGPNYAKWCQDPAPPDGPFLHSILVDPRDPQRLQISLSGGGTFDSRDGGATWRPYNRGVELDFGPERLPEYGQDPHCVVQAPSNPDVFYQQNHCGLYRLDQSRSEEWQRIGRKMPKKVGDIGFGVAVHPSDENTIWTFPMDGSKLWPRTSPEGKPALYRTQNGGRTFERLDKGLPEAHAYMTVKRQALCTDGNAKNPSVAFGTTSGEVWLGRDGGENLRCIARHLPPIQSLRAAVL